MSARSALAYRSTAPMRAPLRRQKPVLEAISIKRARLEEMDDIPVITECLAGSNHAFTVLVNRYQGRITNFLHRSIGDRERAEDLAQETFLRVYRHITRFDRSKKFSTWIYTIASNLAKNELRNRSRNVVFSTFTELEGPDEDDTRTFQFEDARSRPDDLYHKRRLTEIVQAAIAKLPDHHRETFILREIEGKNYEEIAEILDCCLGTVKSRLSRARNSFAAIVEPYIDLD